MCFCGKPDEMDYDNIAEEFVNEVNFCSYTRRRRTVSETERQHVVSPPYELYRRTDERSSAGKSRFSQSMSPPRAEAGGNGCMSPGCFSPADVSMPEDCDAGCRQ